MITDVFPWPSGQQFSGADAWWEYVLTLSESERVDMVLGLVIVNGEFQRLLLSKQWEILDRFCFSATTRNYFEAWQGSTLEELAVYLLNLPSDGQLKWRRK